MIFKLVIIWSANHDSVWYNKGTLSVIGYKVLVHKEAAPV